MDRQNLIIEDLSVSYNGLNVLENLNIDVKNNEFVAIVGKSGCGKTTLLNAIAKFIGYDGKIQKSNKIGIVFQNYSVYPWLTVYENIAFGVNNKKKVNHYLEMIDLSEKKNKSPPRRSAGGGKGPFLHSRFGALSGLSGRLLSAPSGEAGRLQLADSRGRLTKA